MVGKGRKEGKWRGEVMSWVGGIGVKGIGAGGTEGKGKRFGVGI